MRRLSVMFGLVLAVAQGLCAELDLDLPTNDGFIGFNAKERRFTAAVESSPLKKVMAKLGTATGWKVYIDPGAQRTVSAQFTNRTSGEALRMLLGGLNFALVPQEGGPSKLLVFQNSAKDATEFVEPTKAKAVSKDRIPNELVVSLSRNSKRDIESLARSLGAKIVGRNDKLRSYRLQFDSEDAANNARNQLASAPDVRVDDNYYVHTPDPGFQLAGGPPEFNLTPDVNPDACHPIVAVVDTAVQPLRADKSAFLLPSIDISGTTSAAKLANSTPLHGTSMVETILGSMAVTAKDQQTSGVKILPVNVYGDSDTTSTYEVTMGVYEAVKKGATIVNMSLGGDGDSPLLDDLIAQARARGVLFFAAAGNAPTTSPTYPAANPNVFAVTAGDQAGNVAEYANRGDFIDFIAPGTSYMDFDGQTFRVVGTSPATAIVSGAAATFASDCLGQDAMMQRIQQTFGYQRK
ncbi:MAG TPA: S8 family serine peptidase [Verrucomicrobiae bacterium]